MDTLVLKGCNLILNTIPVCDDGIKHFCFANLNKRVHTDLGIGDQQVTLAAVSDDSTLKSSSFIGAVGQPKICGQTRTGRKANIEVQTSDKFCGKAIRQGPASPHLSTGKGWLLDISRCIYILRTGKIDAKTAAGEWALKEKICPYERVLAKAVEMRLEPDKYNNKADVLDYAETIGEDIHRYADVLESE